MIPAAAGPEHAASPPDTAASRVGVARTLRPSERRFILLVHDAIAVTAGVLLSLWTWTITAGAEFSIAFINQRRIWLLAIPLWVIALGPTRQAHRAFDLADTAAGILKAATVLAAIYLVAFFYAGGEVMPRLVAIYVVWNCSLLVFGGRVFARWLLTRAPFTRRVLVAGDERSLAATLDLMSASRFLDTDVVGVAGPVREPVEGVPVVGTLEAIDDAASAAGATDIVIAHSGDLAEDVVQRLLRCHESGIEIVTLAQLYERALHRLPVHHLGPSLVVTHFLAGVPAREASPLAKRALDLIVAIPLAAVALVLLPLVAAAIALESGRPIFYRQERLGRGGHRFTLVKFRTMKQDAEKDGVQWSQADDPRVTRVGRLLRRARLDELPNVASVLRGDLSMVGPRPERPEFIEWLEHEVPLYRARLTATPGLTGWAQVNHKYGDSVEDAVAKLEYDLYYIKHQSVWFDLTILGRTMWTMLRMQGQ